jgi:hypothetical protein
LTRIAGDFLSYALEIATKASIGPMVSERIWEIGERYDLEERIRANGAEDWKFSAMYLQLSLQIKYNLQ